MQDFAVLDDSLVYKNGFYVYTHALVIAEELPQVIVFRGSKENIYSKEQDILDFLGESLYFGLELYACAHYKMYKTVWDLVNVEMSQGLPKIIRQHFQLAHDTAKQQAYSTLFSGHSPSVQ
jgi:hypothetical protein